MVCECVGQCFHDGGTRKYSGHKVHMQYPAVRQTSANPESSENIFKNDWNRDCRLLRSLQKIYSHESSTIIAPEEHKQLASKQEKYKRQVKEMKSEIWRTCTKMVFLFISWLNIHGLSQLFLAGLVTSWQILARSAKMQMMWVVQAECIPITSTRSHAPRDD